VNHSHPGQSPNLTVSDLGMGSVEKLSLRVHQVAHMLKLVHGLGVLGAPSNNAGGTVSPSLHAQLGDDEMSFHRSAAGPDAGSFLDVPAANRFTTADGKFVLMCHRCLWAIPGRSCGRLRLCSRGAAMCHEPVSVVTAVRPFL
jgi:hypothetical protein